MVPLPIYRTRLAALETRVYGHYEPGTRVDGSQSALSGRIDALQRGFLNEVQARPNLQEFLTKRESSFLDYPTRCRRKWET